MVGWESGVRCGRRNRSGLLIKCRARYARGRGSSTRQLQAPVRVRTRAHPKRDTKTRGLRRSVRSQMTRHLVGRIRGVPTAAPKPEPSVSAVRASLAHPRISFTGPSAEPVSPCHPKLVSLTQGRRGTDFWPQPPAMFSLSPPTDALGCKVSFAASGLLLSIHCIHRSQRGKKDHRAGIRCYCPPAWPMVRK